MFRIDTREVMQTLLIKTVKIAAFLPVQTGKCFRTKVKVMIYVFLSFASIKTLLCFECLGNNPYGVLAAHL